MEKQWDKRRLANAKTFGEFAAQWLQEARMADTTRSMRKSILVRDLKPAFEQRLLASPTGESTRAQGQRVGAGDRFALHRSTPNITVDAYERSRVIELGEWMTSRRDAYTSTSASGFTCAPAQN